MRPVAELGDGASRLETEEVVTLGRHQNGGKVTRHRIITLLIIPLRRA